MYCDVCGTGGGLHRYGCPEGCSSTEKPKEICYDCREGIYEDDEYLENENGEKIHYDCARGMTVRELMAWFGYEIKRMKNYD